ncbi:MAG TPA: uroporphyrinogen-III synthase, partial [Acidimicrobiales bacterium]|nr:uroporphyrinogen-III synthase [Acidimicrobiales bacterium]
QRTARTALAALGAVELDPPAVIVIGPVAALDLSWYESRPLFGRRVVVTRAREQAGEAVTLLREMGAEVLELPMIAFADPADGGAALREAAGRLGTYDWVVFTSANAVVRLFAAVRDARAFGPARVAAVGAQTAEALARHGVVADLVPERFVAEGLLDAFPDGSGTVLLPRAEVARDVLPAGLEAKGWRVEVVDAYRTVPTRPTAEELEVAGGADAVMFSSSSTVQHFVAVADRVPPVVACIGPVTARTAEAAGLHVDVVADESTIGSLVAALARRLDA